MKNPEIERKRFRENCTAQKRIIYSKSLYTLFETFYVFSGATAPTRWCTPSRSLTGQNTVSSSGTPRTTRFACLSIITTSFIKDDKKKQIKKQLKKIKLTLIRATLSFVKFIEKGVIAKTFEIKNVCLYLWPWDMNL